MKHGSAAVATRTAAPVLTPIARQLLQRQCACGEHAGGGECAGCKADRRKLHWNGLHRMQERFETDEAVGTDRSSDLRGRLRSGGRPLDKGLRSEMESRFQHDFSKVRVHTGSEAGASARALQANAWTLGNDLVFADGAYDPGSAKGQKLIAHELAHVVQQSGASGAEPQAELKVSAPGDAAEREAEAAADNVMKGGATGVRAMGDGATIHRLSDAWTDVLIGGGSVLGAVGLVWLLSKIFGGDDASKIEHPPQCGASQNKKLKPAFARAVKMVTATLAKLRSFRANAATKEGIFIRDRLQARFKSSTPETVSAIERVAGQILRLISVSVLPRECHAEEDTLCKGVFAAYVPAAGNKVVFCSAFFQEEDSSQASTIVHEHAHAVVGGAHITDRAYSDERVIRLLSTDEALTNAESHAEFIQEVAEQSAVKNPIPQDKEECAADKKPMLDTALARAERMNMNAENIFASSGEPWATEKVTLRNQFLPTAPVATGAGGKTGAAAAAAAAAATVKDISYITETIKKTVGELNSSVEVSCAGGAKECPKGARVTFKEGEKKIYVCDAWLKEGNATQQATELLAVIYGALGGEKRPDWQMGLAKIAEAITTKHFTVPAHQNIVGSPGWTKDLVRMWLVIPIPPKGAKQMYAENSSQHERLSADVPEYKDSGSSGLSLGLEGLFFVDDDKMRRPGPFSPPALLLDYLYLKDGTGRDSQNSGKVEDLKPVYRGQNAPLQTPLSKPVQLHLYASGTLTTKLRMEDPDSGVVRLYQDAMRIVADPPTAPVSTAAGAGAGTAP